MSKSAFISIITILSNSLSDSVALHTETSQFIYCANQLAGSYMRVTLALNGLNLIKCVPRLPGILHNITDLLSQCRQILGVLHLCSY